MTLLLLHMKYARCTWHVMVRAYINDVVVSTWKYQIHDLHFTCLYMMIIYQMLNCKLGDWYNNIPNCDGEPGIYYNTYRCNFVFTLDYFCMDFVYSRFC